MPGLLSFAVSHRLPQKRAKGRGTAALAWPGATGVEREGKEILVFRPSLWKKLWITFCQITQKVRVIHLPSLIEIWYAA
jgi:hypothetical protein